MNRLARNLKKARSTFSALRYGILFVRARWFKLPQKVLVAGKRIRLSYPQDRGATSDFFACCIRNDYGLGQRLSNISTILDIGANVGFFSLAARSHYPRANIHAYEPNPRVLHLLEANVGQLGITVHPEAVGSESGFVSVIDVGDSNLAHTVATDNGTVKMVSLEEAIERIGGTVDLLKLDCEGAEWDLFRSSSPWPKVRNIRMEYHLCHGETTDDVKHALEEVGFITTDWQCDNGFGIVWATASRN